MGNYQCYEPILDKNLQELRIGGKNINRIKKIKVFNSDTLADKLQQIFRYDKDFAIESLKFSYEGYYGRSKNVQELWQEELRLYNNSTFARKPAYKSIYVPTLYDCYVENANAHFVQNSIDDLIDMFILQNFENNPSGKDIISNIKEDIIQAFLNSIYGHIQHIAKDSKYNGELVVFSLLPMRYDEFCPSCFSVIQDDIPLINGLISDFCTLNNIRFVDIFPLFADKDGYLKKDFSDDGLFLNDDGYKVLTYIVATEIQSKNNSKKMQTTTEQ